MQKTDMNITITYNNLLIYLKIKNSYLKTLLFKTPNNFIYTSRIYIIKKPNQTAVNINI